MTGDGGFEEFVETRYGDLLRIAYLLTGTADEAEDLVQAALLRAMRGWKRVDDPMAYVRRVMINHHISMWRQHRARELLTALVPDRQVRDATDRVADQQALYGAMRKLSARTRAVIVLRYWADLPCQVLRSRSPRSVGGNPWLPAFTQEAVGERRAGPRAKSRAHFRTTP